MWDHVQEHETSSAAKRNIVRAVGLKEMYRKNKTLEVCDPEYTIQYPHHTKKMSRRFVWSCSLSRGWKGKTCYYYPVCKYYGKNKKP